MCRSLPSALKFRNEAAAHFFAVTVQVYVDDYLRRHFKPLVKS